MDAIPVLVGVDGLSLGEVFVLVPGKASTIGRSSQCEICLQKVPRFLALSEEQRAQQADFHAVSRQHLRITVNGTTARLENLSAAGSFCANERFDGQRDEPLADGRLVRLRLGPREAFHLMLIDQQELQRMRARTVPIPVDPRAETLKPPETRRVP